LEPFKGRWALPAALYAWTRPWNEAAPAGALREAGLTNVFLEQLYTSAPWTAIHVSGSLSVAHYALVKLGSPCQKRQPMPPMRNGFAVSKVPKLAFDHDDILKMALARLKGKVVISRSVSSC